MNLNKKEDNLIESFSAVGNEKIETKNDITAETEEGGGLETDPLFIRDILDLESGITINVIVNEGNYKKKYFLDSKRNLTPKYCRTCGVAKNNSYGLGLFVKPEGTYKIFPLYVNDYSITWWAFYLKA